jgi:hypothetical protein
MWFRAIEVGTKCVGYQSGQRQAFLDGMVLDLLDQSNREVHIELLDLLVAHGTMLAF